MSIRMGASRSISRNGFLCHAPSSHRGIHRDKTVPHLSTLRLRGLFLNAEPSGGGFEADHITKLINADASTVNVTRALRSFMKKPAREDIVLIYFACHGAPDPDKPSNIYLLTYETDPEDISGTAIPM